MLIGQTNEIQSIQPINYEESLGTLKALPSELLLHIASFFSKNDLRILSGISKACYETANDTSLWKVFAEKLGITLSPNFHPKQEIKMFKELDKTGFELFTFIARHIGVGNFSQVPERISREARTSLINKTESIVLGKTLPQLEVELDVILCERGREHLEKLSISQESVTFCERMTGKNYIWSAGSTNYNMFNPENERNLSILLGPEIEYLGRLLSGKRCGISFREGKTFKEEKPEDNYYFQLAKSKSQEP